MQRLEREKEEARSRELGLPALDHAPSLTPTHHTHPPIKNQYDTSIPPPRPISGRLPPRRVNSCSETSKQRSSLGDADTSNVVCPAYISCLWLLQVLAGWQRIPVPPNTMGFAGLAGFVARDRLILLCLLYVAVRGGNDRQRDDGEERRCEREPGKQASDGLSA